MRLKANNLDVVIHAKMASNFLINRIQAHTAMAAYEV